MRGNKQLSSLSLALFVCSSTSVRQSGSCQMSEGARHASANNFPQSGSQITINLRLKHSLELGVVFVERC